MVLLLGLVWDLGCAAAAPTRRFPRAGRRSNRRAAGAPGAPRRRTASSPSAPRPPRRRWWSCVVWLPGASSRALRPAAAVRRSSSPAFLYSPVWSPKVKKPFSDASYRQSGRYRALASRL